MLNYGVLTQIYVLQEFRENKQKSKKKQQIRLKMGAAVETAKSGSADFHNGVTIILKGQSGKKNFATKLNNVAT